MLRYVGAAQKQLNVVFQFNLPDIGIGRPKYEYLSYKLAELKAIAMKWQKFISGTDGLALSSAKAMTEAAPYPDMHRCDDPQHCRILPFILFSGQGASPTCTAYTSY